MSPSSEREVDQLVDHLFRHQAGRLIATLIRIFGPQHFDLAEDVVQDALLKALEQWPFHGVPEKPAGWLRQVAKNQALDVLRREASLRDKSEELLRALHPEQPVTDTPTGEVLDDVLKMMFMCCHPVIPSDGRVVLTLKAVVGLSVGQIARAFLAQETATAQRIVRAKRQIREAEISFALPPPADLLQRLDSVLEVLYLLFNEGYTAHQGENLIRAELCEEAIRLCTLVTQHPATNLPKSHALLALMLLQAARLPARTDQVGDLLLLAEQDRSLWDKQLIHQGLLHLEQCADGSEATQYHLEAGIAACHTVAKSCEATDWASIIELYDQLQALNPSPVVALNRAIALAQRDGPAAGIHALEAIKAHPALSHYYLLPATLAELWRELGNYPMAASYYQAALCCPCSEPERRFLLRRLASTRDP